MHASKNIFSSTQYSLNYAKAGFGRHGLRWNHEALLWFGVGSTHWVHFGRNIFLENILDVDPTLLKNAIGA